MREAEMIRFLAEKAMGWSIRVSKSSGKVFADAPDGTAYHLDGEPALLRRFNPLTSWADAGALEAAMWAKGWRLFLARVADDACVASFYRPGDCGSSKCTTAPRAITLAAVRALGGAA